MEKQHLFDYLEQRKDEFFAFSDYIWAHPEQGFQEVKSAKAFVSFLQQEGFRVETGVGGMPTAFIAEFGEGGAVIGLLAEYDALPDLSQVGACAVKRPADGMTDGHGCGHNLLGTASLSAAVAIKNYLQQEKIPGRIRLYGTPAEESGSAKVYLVRDGYFDDVDAVIAWHPDNMNYMVPSSLLAIIKLKWSFTGKAAHASMCPQQGRSALDAVTLMNLGTEFLREHMPDGTRIHYTISDGGGAYPNVVPDHAEVVYMIRAPHITDCKYLLERLRKIARGAELMTETISSETIITSMAEMLPNLTFDKLVHQNFEALGPTPFDKADIAFANEIRATLSPEQLLADQKRMYTIMGQQTGAEIAEKLKDKPISDFVYPYVYPTGIMYGSTDVGDVSQVVPVSQFSTCCFPQGTPNHTWQIVSCAVSDLAHHAMLHAGKLMASCVFDLLNDASLRTAIRQEFLSRRNGTIYKTLLPADKKPC